MRRKRVNKSNGGGKQEGNGYSGGRDTKKLNVLRRKCFPPSNAISAGNRDKKETLLRRNAVLDSWPLHYSRSPGNGIVSRFFYLFFLLLFLLLLLLLLLLPPLFSLLFGFPRRNSWGQFLNAANSLDIPRTGNCFYHRSLHFTDCFGEISSPREKYHFRWLQSDNYSVDDDVWTSRTICQIVHLRREWHNPKKFFELLLARMSQRYSLTNYWVN